MKKNSIVNIIKLMRPQSVGLMVLFVYLPILLKLGDWRYALLQVIPIYLLITGQIILNDYFDIEKDKINKGHRPLAAGKVSKPVAKCFLIILLLGAIITALIFYKQSLERLVLFAFVFMILTIYSIGMEFIAPIKSFLTALATVLCLGFIFSYIGFERDIFFLMIVAFLYICSRELLMDIRDYEGDKKYNCNTLAIYLGKKGAYGLAVIFMIIAQILYMLFFVIDSNVLVISLWIISVIVLIVSFIVFRTADSKLQNKIALLLWIPMLMAIPSVIL